MSKTFFDDGLKFQCTQCHACCRHDPGYVFLGEEDLIRFCDFLKISRDDFIDKFCRWVDVGEGLVLSLKEKKNYDCIFWDQGCSVYQGRPVQCRTYPFWKTPLQSLENWKWEGRFCPGIGQNKHWTKEEILAAFNWREKAGVIRKDSP